MAKNLLDKLNVLLQANVREMIPSIHLSLPHLGKDVDHELERLRQQVLAGQDDETVMQTQITALEAEMMRWDEQADTALVAGQEAQARYAIQQVEQHKRKIAMAQTHLADHQAAVYELMQRLTELEAVIQVAQQEAAASASLPEIETTTKEPTLSEAIRQARETVYAEAQTPAEGVIRVKLEEASLSEDEPSVEQDLSARLSRLAKPE